MRRYSRNRRADVETGKIFKDNFLRNFLVILLTVFFVLTAVSASVLYFQTHRSLATHYSAIISIVTELKTSIVEKTIRINIVFFLLIAAGAAVLSLLYSHRIAGPLYRIKQSAKSISQGMLDTEIRLRSKDAVSSFADSVNEMTQQYREKVTVLSSDIGELREAITELKTCREGAKETEDAIKKILVIDNKIKETLKGIKV